MAFDWAVAHQHGGIVRAVVASTSRLQDFTEAIVLTDAQAVRGDPPLTFRVRVAAGMPCEQVADVGETILLLYDVRDREPPVTIPRYYVVVGPDALNAADLEAGLASTAPPTDTDPSRTSRPTSTFGQISLALLVSAFAVGLALVARRTSRRPTHD